MSIPTQIPVYGYTCRSSAPAPPREWQPSGSLRELAYPNIVLAANEGRSYVDAVDITTGKLLDRLTDVSKPCCIETIPGPAAGTKRVFISNIGDDTVQVVEVARDGKLITGSKISVGKAPKRVTFSTTGGSGR